MIRQQLATGLPSTPIDIVRRVCNLCYMSPPKPTTITSQLKKEIRQHLVGGGTYLGLQRETGVLRQSLMKFMAGETSLRLDLADKLATYFGLELRPRRKGK